MKLSIFYRTKRFFRRLMLLSSLFDRIHEQEKLTSDLINSYDYLNQKIGERTMTHADIHFLQSSQVIVVGRYGNKDFVKAYPVKDKDLRGIIGFLRNMETNSKIGRIDMPSTMTFSAVYENDRF